MAVRFDPAGLNKQKQKRLVVNPLSHVSKRKDKIRRRRVITFLVIGLAALSILLYALLQKDPPATVRVGNVYRGDISSYMMISAEIYPGSVEQLSSEQRQRVLKVHVSRGDTVQAGDPLLTLDQSELEEQYMQAKSAREEIEDSIRQAETTEAAQADAKQAEEAAAAQAAKDLNRQLTALNNQLSSTLSGLVQLSSIQPATLDINPELSSELTQLLEGYDPESENADSIIQQAIALLTESVSLNENPDYQTLLKQLQNDIQSISTTSGKVVSSLTGQLQNLNLGLGLDEDLLNQLGGQLGGLGNTLQSALSQAAAIEKQAKESFEASSATLKASTNGVIAQINVEPGDYVGSTGSLTQSSLNSIDLSSLLTQGQSVLPSAGLASPGAVAVVIYDTTRPKAIFRANQFDSNRLRVGMPVQYQYNDLVFSGEITYIAPFANSGSFTGSNELGSELGSLSGLSGEPWREVELSIMGPKRSELIPGFSIDAEIKTASAENVLILPAEAMRRELDATFVYVVDENNVLIKRPITPGIQSEMSVEVLDGLNENDRVVLNPDSSLQPGMTVRIEDQDATQ